MFDFCVFHRSYHIACKYVFVDDDCKISFDVREFGERNVFLLIKQFVAEYRVERDFRNVQAYVNAVIVCNVGMNFAKESDRIAVYNHFCASARV